MARIEQIGLVLQMVSARGYARQFGAPLGELAAILTPAQHPILAEHGGIDEIADHEQAARRESGGTDQICNRASGTNHQPEESQFLERRKGQVQLVHATAHSVAVRTPNMIEEADLAVIEVVSPARRTRAVRLLGTIAELADQPPLIALGIATAGVGVVARDRRLARAGARMLAAELLATAVKTILKRRIDRTRPHVVEDGHPYTLRPGSTRLRDFNSFPSGHTAGAVAVARAVAREYPQHRTAAYTAAATAALIQIPRCQHFPTDVGVGAMIGLAAEAAVAAGERAITSRRTAAPASRSGA